MKMDDRQFLTVEGGFENFLLMYPMLVTDPHWKKEVDVTNPIDLNDIVYEQEYDSVLDIKKKDERSSSFLPNDSFLKPIVNRSLKPAVGQKFVAGVKEDNEISEHVQQWRRLQDDLFAIKKETIRREADLSRITISLDENLDADSRKAALQERERIDYHIMELDDNANNTTMRIDALDKDLKKNGLENIPNRIELIKEEQRMQEELRRLDEERTAIKQKHKKQREQAELRDAQRRQREKQEEAERLKLEREKQQEEARRAQEKRSKELAEAQERRKAALPMYDRTNKPKEIVAPWPKLIQNRNFYHVFGSEVSVSLPSVPRSRYIN